MAYKIQLNSDEMKELRKRKREAKSVKIYRRLECIQLKQVGSDNPYIASFLNVNTNTITEWTKLFLNKGFDGICSFHYDGRRVSKLEGHKEELRQYVKKETPEKLAVIQSWLKNKFGMEVEATWLSRYCKKNSIFLTRRPV